MAQDSPFSLDAAADTPSTDSSDVQRRKKLSLFGLQSLAKYDGQDSAQDLQEQPLYGGQLSKSSSIPDSAGEPSELATERVERGPIVQETSPLLGPEERLGNTIDEAIRGEEGSYGPLSGGQRQASLRDFFRPGTAASGQSAAAAGPTDDQSAQTDTFGSALKTTRQAVGAAKTSDQLSGGKFSDVLRDLFKTGGALAPSGIPYPSGLTLGGAPTEGPSFPSDLSLTGDSGVSTEGLSLGVDKTLRGFDEAPAAAGGSAPGTGASALGLLASLYSIYQQRGGDLSPGQFVSLLSSAGSTASGAGALAGSTGLQAAGAGLGAVGGGIGLGVGIGNAINAFESGDDRNLGAGVGSGLGVLAGLGIGAVVGGPVGAIIGAGLGAAAGGALGGLFGQNLPHYFAVREHAGDVGQAAAKRYMEGVIAAGETGDISAVQRALGESYADSHVRVDMNLPKDVASALGIDPHARIESLTPEQFFGLLKAYSERDGVNNGWFVGSGDVPYLAHDQSAFSLGRPGPAQAIAQQVSGVADTAMKIMTQYFAPQLAQLPPVAPLHWQQAGQYRLAPELEYQTYGGGQWSPADFNAIKQAADSGSLSELYMGGGAPIGQRAGAWQETNLGGFYGGGAAGAGQVLPSRAFAQDYSQIQPRIDAANAAGEQERQALIARMLPQLRELFYGTQLVQL